MSEKRPLVLIGIPSFRRPKGLCNLLQSIALQKLGGPVDLLVFVADNDPIQHEGSDLVLEMVSSYRWPLSCAVIDESGISAARNAILDCGRELCVDFIAMLDDDEVADPNWLQELLDCQRRYEADLVGGPVYFDFEGEPSRSVRNCDIFAVPTLDDGTVALLYATGNLLLRTTLLHEAGWPRFDASFGQTGGEDGEFLKRMQKHNARFAWCPTAIAIERVPPSRSSGSWVLGRSYRKGNIIMRIEQLHGGPLGIAKCLTKAILWLGSMPVSFLLLALAPRRLWIAGKWSQSIGKFAALFGRTYVAYGKITARPDLSS